jgi:hypothetical protein
MGWPVHPSGGLINAPGGTPSKLGEGRRGLPGAGVGGGGGEVRRRRGPNFSMSHGPLRGRWGALARLFRRAFCELGGETAGGRAGLYGEPLRGRFAPKPRRRIYEGGKQKADPSQNGLAFAWAAFELWVI